MTIQMEMKAAILVVDAKPAAVQPLVAGLGQHGFEVHVIAQASDALQCAREVQPDAIILEVDPPAMDGMELLARLRANGVDAPVVFLSSRTALADKLAGLTAGGDDYIAKPSHPDEVAARLGAILRRCRHVGGARRTGLLTFSDLTLDEKSHEVFRAGEPVRLSPNQFDLLRYLVLNAGIVVSKPTILSHLWRFDSAADVNLVETYISQLRRRIDTGDKRLIHTVRGLGYMLRETA